MPFPYTDRAQADNFLFEFFLSTKTVPALFDAWRQLGMVVGIKIEDLDLGYTLDCTSVKDVVMGKGYPTTPPGAALKLTSDTFHRLFSGKFNIMIAFSARKVKTEGNVAGIMKLTRLMPLLIQLYKDYLKKKGLPE
jgi:hypothetical protein